MSSTSRQHALHQADDALHAVLRASLDNPAVSLEDLHAALVHALQTLEEHVQALQTEKAHLTSTTQHLLSAQAYQAQQERFRGYEMRLREVTRKIDLIGKVEAERHKKRHRGVILAELYGLLRQKQVGFLEYLQVAHAFARLGDDTRTDRYTRLAFQSLQKNKPDAEATRQFLQTAPPLLYEKCFEHAYATLATVAPTSAVGKRAKEILAMLS